MIRNTKGVTLIELMVALLISAILVAAVYAFFITQGRTYAVQDNVADMQQNTRVSLLTIVKNVRMAGYGVPAGCALYPDNNTDRPDRIFVSDAAAIQSSPDSERFYAELTAGVGSGADALSVNTDIDNDGNDDVIFTSGDALIISNGTNTEAVEITAVNFDPATHIAAINCGDTLAHSYSASTARVVPAKWYEINEASWELRENGQPLALNIEDLQISYQDDNGTWYCTGQAGHQINPPTNIASIRMVEVNIVARTMMQDAVVEDAAASVQFNQPALEDHDNPVDLNGPDGYRRRVLTTRVQVRNLGGL